jgi:uncharacterized protein YggE
MLSKSGVLGNATRIVIAAAAFSLVVHGGAGAADVSGITVAGVGEAHVKPTLVEINATVNGEAELAADAVVKYRDAKKKAIKAIADLKLPGLSIETNGYSVGEAADPNQQVAMMQGRAPAAGKQKVTVTEQLRLVLKDADKIESDALMDTVLKVLDTARDAGLTIGPPTPGGFAQMIQMQMGGGQNNSLVAFKATDPAAMREQAYKQAMEDATKKAKNLADLAGVKLGPVVAVHEGMPARDQESNNYIAMMMALAGGGAGERDPISTNLSEIPVKVALTVQFEIQK